VLQTSDRRRAFIGAAISLREPDNARFLVRLDAITT
jgi:hypothetical protein